MVALDYYLENLQKESLLNIEALFLVWRIIPPTRLMTTSRNTSTHRKRPVELLAIEDLMCISTIRRLLMSLPDKNIYRGFSRYGRLSECFLDVEDLMYDSNPLWVLWICVENLQNSSGWNLKWNMGKWFIYRIPPLSLLNTEDFL